MQIGLGAEVGVNFNLVILCYSVVQKCLLGNVIANRGFYTVVLVWHVFFVPRVAEYQEIVARFRSSHSSVH